MKGHPSARCHSTQPRNRPAAAVVTPGPLAQRIRDTKFGKSRLVPLAADVAART